MCKLLVLLASASAADDSYFIPPPSGKHGAVVSLVLIQGASSPPGGYRPFAEAVQRASPLKVWVGVPEFFADTPEPLQFASKVHELTGKMVAAGMHANRSVMLAHSLGGVMAQQYVTSHAAVVDALVLYGATVLRKYRTTSFGAPILTLDGTLDGLLRVSRQAEAWWHQVHRAPSINASDSQPLILLEGLNHWSISSGLPPSNVKAHDLPAEVNETAGHALIASMLSDFLVARFGDGAAQAAAATALSGAYASTAALVAPLIAAFEMEGSSHLNVPCDSDYPTNPTCAYPMYPDASLGPRKPPPSPLPPVDCTCGSHWVMQTAQPLMGGLGFSPRAATASLVTKDAFHDVSDVRPFHLPHIFHPLPGTTCDTPSSGREDAATAVCVLNSTTVTMPIHDPLDRLDTGLYPLGATELRTKLKSRQAVWQSAGVPEADVPFNTTDRYNASICREINSAAWSWALGSASAVARARFEERGVPLVMVDDLWSKIGPTGPTWIKSALTFTPANASGRAVVQVAAPYFAVENKKLGDVPFIETVGYHYCKLLSPGRAMEWIYIDGLYPPNL